jgi:hypothetical protein
MGANGVSSDIGMLGYKRALYTIWHLQGRQSFKVSIGPHKDEERTTPCLYSCSSGILFELPWCDPKDVCSDSGAAVELYGEDLINSTYKDYVLTTGKIEGQIREDFEIPKEAEDVQEE